MRGGLLVVFIFSLAFSQPQQPRDVSKAVAASGTVRGRITSAGSGQPLHRVRVTLNGAVQNAPFAVSDTRGEFEITEVPPGTYTLTATRAGYLSIQYGQKRPRELGRTIEVPPGGTVEHIDIPLPRGSVLAGRITDDAGDPAPGVRVEALEYRYIRGHRVLVPARLTTTNDIGEYRLSGLEPGAFRLRASSAEVWESDDGKATYVFAMTYFPGVTGTDVPQSINLEIGQEVGGLDFRLVPGRAASITGIVEDASGQPMRDQTVYLSTIMRTIGGRILGSGQGAPPVKTDGNGGFTFSKLAPGEYLVGTGNDQERVSVNVSLGDGDVQRVSLTPRRAPELTGAVTTDEGTPPPFLASRIRLAPIPADPQRVLPRWGESSGVLVRGDWTFKITDVDEPQLFRVTGLPDDWMLKTVRIGERDITDTPFGVPAGAPDVTGMEIVLSRKVALVTGEAKTQDGVPAHDATVIIFAENSALWGPGSRFVRATRPDDRGRFSIVGLAPGRYRITAVPLVTEGQWEDPAFLQTLERTSLRVELSEGIVETVNLTAGATR
jgi:protocatechuate 3,4-dioxygenase beta subunit